jgi:hypothetical protein
MSLDNFIPTIWSARLLANLNEAHVYAALCNRDYEGEIKNVGDTVKINAIGRVTIGSYVKNTNIAAAETLSDAQSMLTIDKAKYFNFQIDDIDAAQQKPKVMDAAMREAAYGLSREVDTELAKIHTSTPSNNKVGGDGANAKLGGVLTAGSAMYDYLVDLKVKLDENNCPDDGQRWVVVPPWAYGYLLKDNRFINATETGNQIRSNGLVGKAAGFNVHVSNNVTDDGQSVKTYRIIGGHPMAVSFAEQINKVEAYRPEQRFANAVKGLHLWGYKVVRTALIATLYVKNAAS